MTHYQGKRINSPNDVAVAPDGTIWFTDPTFGIIMPNQGALAEPELDHRSVYRFDPRTGDLNRMADFEQPNGLAFTADGATLYVSDTSLSLGEVPGHTSRREARDHRLRRGRGRRALQPAFLLPHRSRLSRRISRSMRAAGCGRARRTACTSGRRIGASWASCPRPRSSRTAPSAARTDGGCSSPRRNICSRSILSTELMKMPVGIADEARHCLDRQTIRVAAMSLGGQWPKTSRPTGWR